MSIFSQDFNIGNQNLGNVMYDRSGFYHYELYLLMITSRPLEVVKMNKIYNNALRHACIRRYKRENSADSRESLILKVDEIDLLLANSSQYCSFGFQLIDEIAQQCGFNLSSRGNLYN